MPDFPLNPHTILLLGASGKIGLEIRKALHSQAPASRVICCSRHPWTGPQYPQEQWQTLDPFADAWPISQPVDVVINAIGAIQETADMPFSKVHVGITQALLAQRAHLGHPRIIQVSALGASAQAEATFLRTKGEADELLLAQENTLVLRPSIVCTPDTMLSQKLQQLLKIARFAFGKLLVPTGFQATQIQPILGSDVGLAIARAAMQAGPASIIELVGPQRIAFGTLITEMAAAQGHTLRLLEVSREIVDSFVKHFVSVWFPGLINYDQFRLLFQDNIGDVAATVQLLGRMPRETMTFWQQEAQEVEATDSNAIEPQLLTDESSLQKREP